MRIIRLDANMATFRTVEFNRTGLSLVIGGRESADSGETYNGVGKSLMLFLIDFCLGSSRRETLAEILPGWVFSLDFELGARTYSAKRATNDQNTIILDGEKVTLNKYREVLAESFDLPDGVRRLTFRSLIPYFLRQSRGGYQAFDVPNGANIPPYDRLLRVGFLLGLDTKLIQKKFDLRKSAEQIRGSKKQFEADPVIRDIVSGGMELELELSEAVETTERLRSSLEAFRVAENYEDVQREARKLRAELTDLRNRLYLKTSGIEQIELSLSLPTDLDTMEVVEIYNEATKQVPELVVKRLEDVTEFHQKLIDGRRDRLNAELKRLKAESEELRAEILRLGGQLDERMRFLGTHNALDEFIALSERLALATARQKRLESYQALLDEYDARLAATARDLQEENIVALEYLRENRSLIAESRDTFRGFARRAYPDKKAGLIVDNNSGDNQLRFDIDARIEADASDGINEVKIFCFDMTVAILHHNHSVEFVAHDSRLFSDIDPRQRAQVLLAARDASQAHGIQYIATMNEDQLDGMMAELDAEEYSELITGSTVLRLTDDSPSGKLLGVDLDLRYEASNKGDQKIA